MSVTYELRNCERLLYLSISGRLTLPEVWRVDAAFWAARQSHHDRFLMDYRGVTEMAFTVAEFTEAGLSAQARMEPQGERLRAAYVASNEQVFGFTRVIEGVWSSHLIIGAYRDIRSALDALGVDAAMLDRTTLIGRG